MVENYTYFTNKARWSSPKAEDLVCGKFYAFTLNFSEQNDGIVDRQRNELLKDRIKAHRMYAKRFFIESIKGIYYKLNMEVSSTGQIHWHGYLVISSIKDYLLNDMVFLKKDSSFCVKHIDNYDKWNDYIHKQYTLWNTEIEHTQFPNTELGTVIETATLANATHSEEL